MSSVDQVVNRLKVVGRHSSYELQVGQVNWGVDSAKPRLEIRNELQKNCALDFITSPNSAGKKSKARHGLQVKQVILTK